MLGPAKDLMYLGVACGSKFLAQRRGTLVSLAVTFDQGIEARPGEGRGLGD